MLNPSCLSCYRQRKKQRPGQTAVNLIKFFGSPSGSFGPYTLSGILTVAFIALSSVIFAAELVGDGITDDSDAIQELLDSGKPVIELPCPPQCYLIQKTLKIHSNQTLRLDPQTTIRLADGAMKHLISNADYETGNENITIEGGIWDGNNETQTCRYHEPGFKPEGIVFSPEEYLGVLMQFKNIRNLTIRDVTLKDPETFAVQMGNIVGFNISNIRFDYNLKKRNMDGIHLHGGCRQGSIRNLSGNTNDDMVALNANDGPLFELSRGEISDVRIDGLWADNGYTAVRILSSGDPVRRIRISDVFGSWRYYVVSFTHHHVHPGDRLIEDVLIDGVFSAKQLDQVNTISPELFMEPVRRSNPLFRIESGMNVRNLTIQNVVRREWLSDAAPTISIEPEADIDSLRLRDITIVNHSASPLTFIWNDGKIGRLEKDSVLLQPLHAPVHEIMGNGTVEEIVPEK